MGATISTTQWYVYGKKHFTKTGYEKHIKSYKESVQSDPSIRNGEAGSDGVSMEGKVVLITGANSGIGKEIATYVAAKGAKHLYMLCRSADRAEAARQEIMAQTKNPNITVLVADVGELDAVRTAVADFAAKGEQQLDCLVCNAGVLLNDRRETSAGMEVTFASHLLGGSYLLSRLLLPQLRAAKEPRVVFVTSGGMLTTKFPDWETATNAPSSSNSSSPEHTNTTPPYDGTNAYSYAKRGQVLLAEQCAKTIPEIAWVTAHPGWTATAAVDEAFGDQKKYLEPMRSTWQGAEGIAWLAATKKSNLTNGAFYLDRKEQKKHISGAFMSEGSFTKNTVSEAEEMMQKLKKAAGL